MVTAWWISSAHQNESIMDGYGRKGFDRRMLLEDHVKLCRFTPLFYSDLRRRLNTLLTQNNNVRARGSWRRGHATLELLEAFGAALAAENTSWRKVTSIFGDTVTGVITIDTKNHDLSWQSALMQARALVCEWIKRGLYTLETAPRRIACIRTEVFVSRLDVYIRCAILTGDNLIIEYEHDEIADYSRENSDHRLETNFGNVLKRLLWLTPFDIVSI
eukprot:Gregarina_sp_Pseudo_9__1931@NODE_2328_length_1038_cov_21_079079_g2144_i0_p1_GENE_NODE_2328_length_1038_cov_21_079079_g2144_i0NODE_2328_length_1038_cov_21_079079_g2144_i0_p1_ORF_typecomplete_len227_score12_62_NODE_2328_length_1038_cov_21_079079_g2144_i03571007